MRNPNEHAPLKRRGRPTSSPLILLKSLFALGLSLAAPSCKTLDTSGSEDPVAEPPAETFTAARSSRFNYCPLETVRQTSASNTGLAALVSVMQYWEHEADLAELESRFPAKSETGYSLLQLRKIAAKEDLIAFALTMKDRPLDQIKEQLENGRPVITPLLIPDGPYFDPTFIAPEPDPADPTSEWSQHFVVVFGQSEQQLLLMDPAHGVVKLDKAAFIDYWSSEKFAALLCSSF